MEGNKEEAEYLFVFCLRLIVSVEVDGKVLEQVIFIQATSRSRVSAADAALIHAVGVDANYLVCLKNKNCSEMCALIFVIRFTETVNIFDFGRRLSLFSEEHINSSLSANHFGSSLTPFFFSASSGQELYFVQYVG